MTIADATWVATALLHKEHVSRQDFSVQEIAEKAKQEKLVEGFRPGLKTHASQHCVANKPANSADHRMLFKTAWGRRRLFKQQTDECHADRQKGKVHPEKSELPQPYQSLVDWYDTVYAVPPSEGPTTPTDVLPDNNLNQEHADVRIPSSISTLLRLFSKPLFASSSGDVVIPRSLLNELGVKAGVQLSIRRENDYLVLQPITEDFISSLVGSCKGKTSLVEAREREHRTER